MQCVICKKKAVISRRYEGRALCRKHFFDSLEKTMRKKMRLGGLLPRGAHVAICVSGDCDSMLLLYLLHKLNRTRGDLKISAISVDEGIRGYRKKMISQVMSYCKELDVPLYSATFKDAFGMTVDEIYRAACGRDADACGYCRKLRVSLVMRKAREIMADRIAIADNMDDEAVAITAKYFGYGAPPDILNVLNLSYKDDGDEEHVKIIKPLCLVPADETALYARLKKIGCMQTKCPYAESSPGWKIRGILNDLEGKHAGIKFNILKTEQKIEMISQKK